MSDSDGNIDNGSILKMAERQVYQKAIDLLMSNELDYKKVCVELAKINPVLFCELLERSPLTNEIRTMYLTKGKIEAIKYYRNTFNTDLKTAKNRVEEICADIIAAKEVERAITPNQPVYRQFGSDYD